MKKALILFSILFSSTCLSGPVNHCGEIKRMRTWVNGNDTYGIWLEYASNPSSCSGGFYLPKDKSNTDKVYSFLLASKMSKSPICIQTYENKISNRCAIHYVMDK